MGLVDCISRGSGGSLTVNVFLKLNPDSASERIIVKTG